MVSDVRFCDDILDNLESKIGVTLTSSSTVVSPVCINLLLVMDWRN